MRLWGIVSLAIAVMFFPGGMAMSQSCAPDKAFGVTIDHATKSAVLDSALTFIDETYVFPGESKNLRQEIRDRLDRGIYDSLGATDAFAKALTEDLRTLTNDLHFAVTIRPPNSTAAFCAAVCDDEQAMREMNYGFKTVQIMPGNIGYLELTACTDVARGGATASAAMRFLSGTEALIIDLRANGGGLRSMGLYLSSFLFEPGMILHSLAGRNDSQPEHSRSAAYIDGERRLDIPVYVLTSARTASAAESFAYDLKHHGRATIIGEQTAGAGHCAQVAKYEFDDFQLEIMVPAYQPIHPVTGGNWQGSGVAPDIEVAAADALDIAHERAMRQLQPSAGAGAACTVAGAAQCLPPAGFAPGKGCTPGRTACEPITMSLQQLRDYVGQYGPRHVSLENGSLFAERDGVNTPKSQMIPVAPDLFEILGSGGYMYRFERDAEGRIVHIVGYGGNLPEEITKRTD